MGCKLPVPILLYPYMQKAGMHADVATVNRQVHAHLVVGDCCVSVDSGARLLEFDGTITGLAFAYGRDELRLGLLLTARMRVGEIICQHLVELAYIGLHACLRPFSIESLDLFGGFREGGSERASQR